MTHPTDDELEAMAARLEASAYVRSPAHEIEAAAMLRACKGITVPDALDPDMPAQALKLHMGEMSAAEQRTARAAIRWANSRRSPAPDVREALRKAEAALADIAEGEPDTDDTAEKIWCKDRAATALTEARAALKREAGT